eukprot:358195-Rhodomonas_salina.1
MSRSTALPRRAARVVERATNLKSVGYRVPDVNQHRKVAPGEANTVTRWEPAVRLGGSVLSCQ